MEESLKILKEIGAQQIHKDTHISRDYAQAIIHASFEGLNLVQLMGFISILEREYNIDLSTLKEQGKEYFGTEEDSLEKQKIFVAAQKKKKSSKIYILLLLLIFGGVIYYSFAYLSSMANTYISLDNSTIEDAQKRVTQTEIKTKPVEETTVLEVTKTSNVVQVDTNTTATDVNASEVIAPINTQLQDKIQELTQIAMSLKILPRNKIWAGYINIQTNQKYQQIFRKEFTIDVNKDWLLLFGSGTVHLEVNGEKKTFSSAQNMRFKYIDGAFSKIDVTEFKSLNKGRKW